MTPSNLSVVSNLKDYKSRPQHKTQNNFAIKSNLLSNGHFSILFILFKPVGNGFREEINKWQNYGYQCCQKSFQRWNTIWVSLPLWGRNQCKSKLKGLNFSLDFFQAIFDGTVVFLFKKVDFSKIVLAQPHTKCILISWLFVSIIS